MHELPCSKHATGAEGFVVAWNARNGRQLWRVRAGTVESTPLLVGKMLYFGSWDHHLYAYRIRGQRRPLLQWTFTRRRPDRRRSGERREPRDRRDARAGASTASTGRRAASAGTRRRSPASAAASTSTRRRRSPTGASSSATPTAPSTPSAHRAAICSGRGRSGRTSTRPRPSGGRRSSSAPGTGTSSRSTRGPANVRWRFDAPASITGAPTVLAGLVYFSTCGRCGAGGLRRVKNGPRGTWALNARNGDPVWHFPDGKYSALVADGRRIYISGRNKVYALIPQLRWEKLQRLKAKEKCAHLKRARARARCLSKARRGTSSGTHGSRTAGRTSKRKNQ